MAITKISSVRCIRVRHTILDNLCVLLQLHEIMNRSVQPNCRHSTPTPTPMPSLTEPPEKSLVKEM